MDPGLWYVNQKSTTTTGVKATAEIVLPSNVKVQQPGSKFHPINHNEIPVPGLLWYAFIGFEKGSYNGEAGICINTDGKVYLFQLGSIMNSQYVTGWNAVEIYSSNRPGTSLTLSIDLSNSSKLTFSAGGKALTTTYRFSQGHFASGCRFSKQMTLGVSNYTQCFSTMWLSSSGYNISDRNASITNMKMGKVTVTNLNNTTEVMAIQTNPTQHAESPCTVPTAARNTASHTSTYNVLTANLAQ